METTAQLPGFEPIMDFAAKTQELRDEMTFSDYHDEEDEAYTIQIIGPAAALWWCDDNGALTSRRHKAKEFETYNDAYKYMQSEKYRWACVMCWVNGGEE